MGTGRRASMIVRWLLCLAATATVLWPAGASAHPLGLPAFAQVSASGSEVALTWNAAPDDVAALARSLGVDVAEGQVLTREQDAAFAASPELRQALLERVTVRQNGSPCPADVRSSSVVEAGVTWRFTCPAPVTAVEITIAVLTGLDDRYRTLATATTASGSQRFMFTSTAPTHAVDLSGAGAASVAPAPPVVMGSAGSSGLFGGSLFFESELLALIDRGATPAGLALGLLLALGVGGLHALAPGHGKAIGAAYLVGDRGRRRDALLLGAAVAVMHTWSVLALGFALYWASSRPPAELLSAWLRLLSGIVVSAVGAVLLVRRLKERRQHDHVHPSPAVAPLSWQGLAALGAAGGLLPSPSALLVLFTALAVGRVGYGLSLIGAFSVGLGVTVGIIGLAVLHGRDLLTARTRGAWSRRLAVVPTVAAAVVVMLGLGVAAAAAIGLMGSG